jgi:hypothetical protein
MQYKIWNNVIPDGARGCVESDKCAMGARSVLLVVVID